MRAWRSFAPLLVILVLAVIWFVYVSEPAARWLAHFTNRASYNGQVVGRIVHAEGSVRIVHGTDITLVPSPVDKPVEFRDGDRVQTSVDSKATLILNSEDELEIGSGSVLQFQLWNPKDAGSAIYVQDILGVVNLRKAGVHGKAYVVRDGRLYLPGQKPSEKPMALTVLKSAPLDLHLAENEEPTDFQTGNVNAADEAVAPPPVGLDPETLSNEYIEETIAGHQAQLQNCWLTRLKDAPGLKGQIILQFQISKRGRVKELRVADASIADQPLQKCVLEVFERLNFRPFKGSDIALSYPINFE